jgi:prephenate dehydrogenase
MDVTGIIGYGRFGRALAELILDAGGTVRAWDPQAAIPEKHRAKSLANLAETAQVLVLAVPVTAVRAAAEELRGHLISQQLVLEVSSVKHGPVEALQEILGDKIPWAATHPLFGPTSIARGEPLRAVVCPNASQPRAASRATAYYESLGIEVLQEDADRHDKVMAETHALTFFLAKGLFDMGAGQNVPFAPPSFQAISQTIDAVRSDAGHLFYPIARQNPYAAEAREALIAALGRIHGELATAPEPSPSAPAPLAIPASEGPAPALQETRQHIDELDRRLLALLSQRVQLSRHAARVKNANGRPIRDPQREQSLLEDREAWAQDAGLVPEEIRQFFMSVLSLSREEQRRWLERSSE